MQQSLVTVLAPDDNHAAPRAEWVGPVRRWEPHRDGLAAHSALFHVAHRLLSRALLPLGVPTMLLRHAVDLHRGERGRAPHDQDGASVERDRRRCSPGDRKLRIEQVPPSRPKVEKLDAREHLSAAEDVVAAAYSCEKVIRDDHNPSARAGHVQARALGPCVSLWIVDLAAAQRLHHLLARQVPVPQRAAAHREDAAVERSAAVAPARALEVR
mmetsp:Transcript_21249/g.61346  ORF Transcript_21249/g.61346 Transcript_21249/m.61346 type:complete len:213 (-) Transcript_21249:482-1120(-)